jgi:demethylmenaquinone methyltransferase / 2-methoxy-6-polyprenyl-1,4-benzoquinol methylase
MGSATGQRAELDKSGRAIREMFAGVAPRYDLLNRLISGFLDEGWRRRAAAMVDEAPPGPILDLCAGTGDQARAVHRRGRRVAAADFTLPMLVLARRKLQALGEPRPAPLAADALALPFRGGTFAGAVVSFGLRNVADLDRSLAELAGATARGGRLVVLEAAVPRNRLVRFGHRLWCRWILPRLGRLLSPRAAAYEYLPASVLEFPQREAFLARMAAAGFTDLAWRELVFGSVCLYEGTRRQEAPPAVRREGEGDREGEEVEVTG